MSRMYARETKTKEATMKWVYVVVGVMLYMAAVNVYERWYPKSNGDVEVIRGGAEK